MSEIPAFAIMYTHLLRLPLAHFASSSVQGDESRPLKACLRIQKPAWEQVFPICVLQMYLEKESVMSIVGKAKEAAGFVKDAKRTRKYYKSAIPRVSKKQSLWK